MRFGELQLVDALIYRDRTRLQQEPMLGVLARALRDSSGPIEAMDGSFDSLMPLWEWAMAQIDAGLESFDHNSYGTYTASFGAHVLEIGQRHEVLGEALEHYLFAVYARHYPGAHFDVYVHGPSKFVVANEHSTVVMIGDGRWAEAPGLGTGLVARYLENVPRYKSPLALHRTALHQDGARQHPTGPISLLDFIDSAPPARFDLMELTPRPAAKPTPKAKVRAAIPPRWQEHIFAASRTRPDELDSARGLDRERVAQVLTELGFQTSLGARDPQADDITERAMFVPDDDAALATLVVSDGKLRALKIVYYEADASRKKQFEAAFARCGVELDAKFSTEEEMWTRLGFAPVTAAEESNEPQTTRLSENSAGWKEMIFAATGADPENAETARPLNREAVAAVLAELRFETVNGRAATAEELKDGAELLTDDEAAIAIIEAAGGEISAVNIEYINVTTEREKQIAAAFDRLGVEIGAKYAAEDEMWLGVGHSVGDES